MIYGLLVRSPAPPVVALVGLLGILMGEQMVPIGKQMIAGPAVRVGRMKSHCAVYTPGFQDPGKLPLVNPFAAMGLESSDRETPTATLAELHAFRTKAKELGLSSLATAALIGWEWLQREIDIFATFEVTHYRPKERPNAVRVLHEKTGEKNWIPLFDDATGTPLYPELMAELDALRRARISGLMLRRDWGQRAPWPTWPKEDEVDLTHMSRKIKEVIRAAELRDELTFTSFRHGGFTEAADSDLTDAEMRAQGRHKSAKVLPRYAKRTMKQALSVLPVIAILTSASIA